MPLLFVYGTLKRGHLLHHHMGDAPCLGAARTTTGYALYRLDWYPALVPERDAAGVSGELFEVTPALLSLLDVVEGAPDQYQRVEIEIAELDGQPVSLCCLTYVYRQPLTNRLRITNGDWELVPDGQS